MAKSKITDFRLDHRGLAKLLKSGEFAAAVRREAEAIADSVRAQTDMEVVVDSYQTDRSAASVTIRDPIGLGLEVRDGVLTRAAAARGLEVTRRV